MTVQVTSSLREVAMAAPVVDKTPPLVAIVGAPTKTDQASVSLAGTASDNVQLLTVGWVNDRGGSGTARLTGTTKSVTWSISKLALLAGNNTITVTATDKAGNKATAKATIWRGDITPPTVQITNNGTAAAMVLSGLAGTAGDNVALQSVTWVNSLGGSGSATRSGTATAGTWSVATLPLQVGTNVITVTATDTANNTRTTSLSVVQADITPPTLNVTSIGSAASMVLSGLSGTVGDNIALQNVTWVNSLGGSGTATLAGTANAGTWSVPTLALEVGTNLITVTATDTTGNRSSTSVSVVQADITPPTLNVTSIGSAAAMVLSGLAGTASDNVALQSVTWVNSLGGGGTATVSGTAAASTWSVATLPLQVGTNVITVTAVDTAGNPSTANLSIVQADITPPTVLVTHPGTAASMALSGLAGTAGDNIALLSVTWVNSLGGSGIATLTGSPTAGNWSVDSLALQVGTNVITMTATDTTGNLSTASLSVVQADITPPTVNVTSLGTAAQSVLSGLAGTASDNIALASVTWVNSLGGSGDATLAGTSAESTWSIPELLLQVGTNVITVTVTDTAGNLSTANLSVVQADITPPTVQVANAGYAASGTLSGLAGTAGDNIALLSITWENSLGGSGIAALTGSPTAGNWSVASLPLQVGTNVITVTATDTTGNKSSATTTSVVLYPTAPLLDLAALTGALVPFEMPWNDNSGSLLNQSGATLKPAGLLGPITVSSDGHFQVGGSRIRLFGINLSLGSLTPTKLEADAIAANLAKQGFNAVRLHGLDRPYIGRTYKQQGILNNDWTTINPAAGDLFDYFVAKLIQNGMYVKIMAHSDRVYPEAPDCIDHCEGLDNYLPVLIDSQKNFLAMLLGRVNPYTGRSYGSEPGIFAVEISNEDSLTHRWRNGTIDTYVNSPVLGPKYGVPLKNLWNAWLATRYLTPTALSAAWGITVSDFADVAVPLRASINPLNAISTPLMIDWWRFVGATEESYWSGMTDHIKLTLGFQGLVSGGQMNYSPTFFKPKSDFTDIHLYWHDSPSIAGTYVAPGQPNDGYPIYQVVNDSAQYVATDPKSTLYTAANRVAGRPHVVSEYSVRFQNTYGSEAEMLMLSYALFQDWDGVFLFTYSDQNLVSPEKKQGFLFNEAIRKVTRVPATIMFRRADVLAGLSEKVYRISKERTFDRLSRVQSFANAHFDLGGNIREPFRSRVSHTVVDTWAQEVMPASSTFNGNDYNTDTNQLRWKAGVNFTIDTPRSQMRTAVLDGQTTALGSGVSVTVGRTLLGRALLTLTSLADTQNIPLAPSMLLTVTGDEMAEYGWRSADRLQRVVGVGSNRLEAVPAQVTIDKGSLDSSKRMRVYALDDTGNIKLEVPVSDNGTTLSFVVGPGTNAPWYVIDQR